jgi:signal transduction histidine kinase
MAPRSHAIDSKRVGRRLRFSTADLELLAEASRRLSGPLDLSCVLGRASSFIVPDVADWYVLALTQADGHMRALAYEHRDPARRAVLASLVATSVFDDPTDSAMARAARGTLGWAPRFATQPWNVTGVVCGWSEPDFALLGTGSVICAPLSSASERLGAVLLAREAQDSYDSYSIEVTAEIAHQLGIAIANACRFEAVQEQLQQANEALAVAAHELRSPTAALRGNAQLLLRQYEHGDVVDPVEVEDALTRIDRQAVRLSSMIDRLMDAAALASGKKLTIIRTTTDVRDLVSNVVDLARAGAPDRLITIDAPRSVPAEVDALRIEQVLANLIDNAFKFSPRDTRVEVSLRLRQPGMIVLAVRDHGVGVPVDQREQIFDRFVQAHRDRAPVGLGLGLYLSQGIVEQHGGHLSAEYPQDGGARFIVELPALDTITADHHDADKDGQGGPTHDAARTQSDWSTRGHPGRTTSHVRPSRLNRVAGVPGVVQAGVPA